MPRILQPNALKPKNTVESNAGVSSDDMMVEERATWAMSTYQSAYSLISRSLLRVLNRYSGIKPSFLKMSPSMNPDIFEYIRVLSLHMLGIWKLRLLPQKESYYVSFSSRCFRFVLH